MIFTCSSEVSELAWVKWLRLNSYIHISERVRLSMEPVHGICESVAVRILKRSCAFFSQWNTETGPHICEWSIKEICLPVSTRCISSRGWGSLTRSNYSSNFWSIQPCNHKIRWFSTRLPLHFNDPTFTHSQLLWRIEVLLSTMGLQEVGAAICYSQNKSQAEHSVHFRQSPKKWVFSILT